MEVKLYSMNKRRNSTARPSGLDSALTVQVTLKDSSGVLHPLLEIYQSAAWNPSSYNYAYIADFSRYYWIDEWTYINGRWQVSMSVDPLATYKTEIGNSTKYILRCANLKNSNVIDTLYPSVGDAPTVIYNQADFHFSQDFADCCYVLGVANRSTNGVGAIAYYVLTSAQIRSLVQYMLVAAPDLWTNGFAGMTDVLYRSLYSPFDYIKSCRAFPIAWSPLSTVNIMFGNYTTDVQGSVLGSNSAGGWFTETHDLSLPSGWTSWDAKFRSNPFAHLYLFFPPWGMIELNPLDFAGATAVRVRCSFDLMSGDGILYIHKVYGSEYYFVTMKVVKASVDIALSAASINASGLIAGITTAAGAAVDLYTGSVGTGEALTAIAGGVTSASYAGIPTASGSTGTQTGGFSTYEGICQLIYTCSNFTLEDPDELGNAYMQKAQISSLHPVGHLNVGYVKCADGEVNCNGMPEELESLENFLTGGFFYE